MSPTEPSPDERLRALQDWLGQYKDDDPAREKIAAEAKKTAQILEKLQELDKLKESLGNKRGLQDIADALRQQMTALLGQQVKDKVRDLGVPESQPLSQELNEAYFLDDGNSTRIGNDLNAFDGKEEGREKRWKELKATGEDKVEPGTRARISTGQEMLWKNYLRTASDILHTAGFPVKTETGRFSSSRTLEILKWIADGTIKKPEDVKRPKRKKPTPNPEPEPVLPPQPPPDPVPTGQNPPEPSPNPPEPTPAVAPPIASPTPAPHPNPPLQGEGTRPEPVPPAPEPTTEAAAEAPSFSRYLRDILADPTSREAQNLLEKLKGPSGRLWIDKKKRNPDGSEKIVRVWLFLDITAADKSKRDEEFIEIIKNKLTPGNLRFRVDDLSAGNSWKEKWTTKKAEVSTLVTNVTAASDAERPTTCAALAGSLFGTDAASERERKTFLALLQQYLARPDGKSDIWTHVRNAYWHADGWKNETDAKSELGGVGIPPDSLKPPSYASAKIRVWQKIGEEPRSEEIEGKAAPLFYNGTKFAAEIIEKTVIADGVQKGTWYRIGPHWVREEHLRISLRQNPPLHAGEGLGEGTFELMAWQVQTEEPKEPPAPTAPPATPPPTSPSKPKRPPTTPAGSPAVPPKKGPPPTATPSAASGGPKPLPKSPPVVPPPDAKKKSGTDAMPQESHESAEILREQEVIAIPDIHGNADALFASLKGAGYAETSDSSGNWRKGWKLTEAGKKARIVFTGDFFDRGHQNADVAALINDLRKRKGEGVTTLFGNHDVMLLRAAKERSGGAIEHLWQNDGDTTLREILGQEEWNKLFAAYQTCANIDTFIQKVQTTVGENIFSPGKRPRWVLSSLSTLYQWWTKEGRAHIQQVCETHSDACSEHLAELRSDKELQPHDGTQQDLDRTLATLEERVTRTGAFAELVCTMQPMTQIDDVLYLHAGLSEEWIRILCEKGVDGANAHFHALIQDPVRLANMAGGGDPESAVLWSRELYTFLKGRPDLAQKLLAKGIRMIVCGHTEQRDGQLHHKFPSGLHIVYGDTGLGGGGGSFTRTHGRTSPKNGEVEGHLGAWTDLYGNKSPARTIPLAKLPPSK